LPGEFPLPCIILSNLALFIKGFRGGFRRRGSSVDGPPGRKGVSEESAGECDGFCGKMKDETHSGPAVSGRRRRRMWTWPPGFIPGNFSGGIFPQVEKERIINPDVG
jgi:hypothetical protein